MDDGMAILAPKTREELDVGSEIDSESHEQDIE